MERLIAGTIVSLGSSICSLEGILKPAEKKSLACPTLAEESLYHMSGTVVFVDDEFSVLKSLQWVFKDDHYQVLTFDSPMDALAKMEEIDVAAVVADQRMPQMTGTAFLEEVKKRWPDTVRIIMTAFSDFKAAVDAINQGNVYRFIYKPWDEMELKMTIKNAVSYHSLRSENRKLFKITKRQNIQLQDLNKNLEQKVKARTIDLLKTNRQLQREVEERKNAEKDRRYAFERMQRAMRETIQAMALTLETRDPYTAGHQQRVAGLAGEIAKELGLSGGIIEGIRMSGLIHDLGKISVPAEILAKPTRLSEAEFNIIRTHPQIGYDILKDIEFPWPVAQTVYQHHEKMDGSGYPRGLSGKDILIEARIMLVADVVEAMTFHRPYRPAYGIDDALKEIIKNRGTLYDKNAVEACLKLFKEERFQFQTI